MRKQWIAAAVLALGCVHAQAEFKGSPDSSALVSQALVLLTKQQHQEAIALLERARALSPQASEPVSTLANALLDLSYRVKEGNDELVAKLRGQAGGLAQHALTLAPEDPLAKEVLRALDDPDAHGGYQPAPAALAKLVEGEAEFHASRYDAARQRYREAQQADPRYAQAWVMEGDCYFMQQDWAAAEKLFLKATQVDPNLGQAWRFLADARLRKNDALGFFAAAEGAIGAAPNQKPSWDRLAGAAKAQGRPMESLNYVRKADVTRGADGKFNLTLAAEFKDAKPDENPDYAIWLAYGLARIGQMGQMGQMGAPDAMPSPFAMELASWNKALAYGAELTAAGKPPASATLRHLIKLRQEEQLEPGILLLMYREAYRADLEAWKKEHPGGVHAFIASYHLTP